ncbi:maleylpyruvate isomerase family mycothiol-dependent enzyme [Janibacter sp. HTCC2649]|uniref:maleylpyruvate isomerase family mycothiol-dependent enzyme n=1 Tax=Janibacter sp. HTCC2649 TaxID=313589 RepID=UPI0002DCE9E9|nr:maleylpyruvate isomerase family mycothiol-dependent enzyme [Janibacter sp. HTCC2649]
MNRESHLVALTAATDRLVRDAASAGLDAPVPTCPGWTVRDLLAHQGAVHRWATANIVGDGEGARDIEAFEREGLALADPVRWVAEGGAALVAALEAAPADLDALVFLKDAPAAREFWTRRQCHETTIHAVDALSAKLSRMPSAHLADIGATVAADGIDELLTGFLPRGKYQLRSETPMRIAVRPSDVDLAWIVEVSAEPLVSTRHTPGVAELDDVDVTFNGSAAELYLGLWNRGEEFVADDAGMLARWREFARVI